MTTTLDRRTHPVRPDLADARLKGLVEAARFVAGEPRQVASPTAWLRREPRPDAPVDTQALLGERVTVFDEQDGFAWAQLETDAYVGYIALADLAPAGPPPTHRVSVLRTFAYPRATIKETPVAHLSLGAAMAVSGFEDVFAVTPLGHIWADHLVPVDHAEPDFVAVAEAFVGVPYLWGGRSSLGLDCSGLAQLSLAAAGIPAPRDSDMQERACGAALPIAGGLPALRRGDLIFWRGHVGIMTDPRTLLHANGHHMLVVAEPLADAIARIEAKGGGPVTAVKRL